ncbi:hypothetical protein J6590_061457 [Homalodisca vitripennis]|nr:hypothetical protein J6590_061457 [Homalodisca vitripennis]
MLAPDTRNPTLRLLHPVNTPLSPHAPDKTANQGCRETRVSCLVRDVLLSLLTSVIIVGRSFLTHVTVSVQVGGVGRVRRRTLHVKHVWEKFPNPRDSVSSRRWGREGKAQNTSRETRVSCLVRDVLLSLLTSVIIVGRSFLTHVTVSAHVGGVGRVRRRTRHVKHV